MMTLYGLRKPYSSLAVERRNTYALVKLYIEDHFIGTLSIGLEQLTDTILSFADVIRPIGELDDDRYVSWRVAPVIYAKDVCISDTGDVIDVNQLEIEQ